MSYRITQLYHSTYRGLQDSYYPYSARCLSTYGPLEVIAIYFHLCTIEDEGFLSKLLTVIR